jgi:L-alanine-DL-glutamate epimerase-like enolase superfamily enzyme
MEDLRIKRLTVTQYKWKRRDLTGDYNGFNHVYLEGGEVEFTDYVMTIETEAGITGEYSGGVGVSYAQVAMAAQYLIGKNALEREKIWNDLKRALRKHDKFGMGPIDCALWDIAGKMAGQPVYQLLGGWRDRLPAYASTFHGDENGGLDSPEAFGEFAIQCREMGYPAFKIHGWGHGPIRREQQAVLATAQSRGRQHGPDDRSGLRIRELGRRAQGREGLRRGQLLLVRGSVQGRRASRPTRTSGCAS